MKTKHFQIDFTAMAKHSSVKLCLKTFSYIFVFVTFFPSGCLGLETKSDPESSISDFRNVRYEDLLPRIDQFSETGVSHFSEILFDFARYQVKRQLCLV
jgi:hypothetical protein